MSAPSLILASASPRRRELLERVGYTLDVRPADVDETPREGEEPKQYVTRIALAKAAAVVQTLDDPRFVLAADTTVTINGEILAKAESPDEAREMLRKLSGRVHQVWTAYAIVGPSGDRKHGLVGTDVSMIDLTDVLDDYVASEEWRGKAGAYAVQGIAAALVRDIDGSITNVIGLPLVEVIAALRDLGGPAPRFPAGSRV